MNMKPVLNGAKLRELFVCRAEFIRPVAVGGYPHCGYIRDDRWNSNVVGRIPDKAPGTSKLGGCTRIF
jgi:hypothetical protein